MTARTSHRFRTARKIQAAAVSLAVERGLAHVTTEEIARKAEISTRTFFNYYPYKEAAIMGPPLDYPQDAGEAFVAGTGPLIGDLERLIEVHLRRFLGDREMVGHIRVLAATDPKLGALYSSSVLARRAQMRDLLARRLPDAEAAMLDILAAAIVAATNAATVEWVSAARNDFIAIARKNLALILPAAHLLAPDQPARPVA